MGIRLDWQVESEQSRVRATEDPEARRARRAAQRRFVGWLLALAGVVLALGAGILWRLQRVETGLRQDLLDTVEIEVTALRLGDFPNFMAVQRSASESFILDQSRRFQDYQALKQAHRITLTGDVLDVAIDQQRARVMLRELIDGVPYRVLWFYWYYKDGQTSDRAGWRHVPDDLTFWGDEATIERGPVRIAYRALDQSLAEALAPRLETWWLQSCVWLGCTTPPALRVEIVAERPSSVKWSERDPWTLRITSPLVTRARADVALTPELERTVAEEVAARLVRYAAGETTPLDTSDAAWLHADMSAWLADRLVTPVEPGAPSFVESVVARHGTRAPGLILAALRGGASLSDALAAATGSPLATMSVDQLSALQWAGFFEWRLALEARLLFEAGNQGAYLALYDPDDAYAARAAQQRLANPPVDAQIPLDVTGVTLTREGEQTYAYVATARTVDGVTTPGETVIWRLAGGTWKRTS